MYLLVQMCFLSARASMQLLGAVFAPTVSVMFFQKAIRNWPKTTPVELKTKQNWVCYDFFCKKKT